MIKKVTKRGENEVEWKIGICPNQQPYTPLDELPRLRTPRCDVLTQRMKSGSNLEKETIEKE
jgi:hypothetical protein